jgi:DNA polymerase-1
MLKDYFGFYQVLEEFIKKAGNIIEKKKFSITPFGIKRFFEDKKLFANNSEMYKYIGRLRREGVNHIIQGGIADVVKIAMREIFYNNPFGDGVKILLQVHDELVFAVRDDLLKDAQEFLEDKMIKAGELFITKVPVKVDANVAKYWEKG